MIYITGDIHREQDIHKINPREFTVGDTLTENDYVIICGDFGCVWDGSTGDNFWLKWLDSLPWNTLFIDGNHENFDVLNNDPAITGFEITDKNEKPFIRVDKSEFVEMAQKSEEIEEGERRIVEAATVNIVRVSFEENLKWDFYYRGIKISAKIADPNFYELIDKGEAFAKGDILEIELQINQRFEEGVNTYVTKSYQVNKIVRHLSRNEQQKLNFNTE